MKRIALVAALALLTSLQVYAEETFIAVLNEPQTDGPVESASAKILFVKKGNQWRSVLDEWYGTKKLDIPDLQSTNWTVAFDGRSLGQLRLVDPDPADKKYNQNEDRRAGWFISRDKVFKPQTGQKIPKVANRAKLFGGWASVPENRPLVLVSKPNFSDPEHWKPISEEDSQLKALLHAPLRLVMGKFMLLRCPNVETYDTVPFDFQTEDMVIYQAYGSKNGLKIVAVGLDGNQYGCDGPQPEEWSANWFLIDGKQLDFIGREMTLLDAGDYDGDGKSELLFWHSGYNEDGYILISDSFTQKTAFTWKYH